MVIIPNVDTKLNLDNISNVEELSGELSKSDEQKLMSSLIEGDKESLDESKLINESINQGLNSFTPDAIFENLIKDYKTARNIYGKSFLRHITDEDEASLERNIKIPEFQRKIKNVIDKKIGQLKEKRLIDKELKLTERGYSLASIKLYLDELNNMRAKGIIGYRINRKESHYGSQKDYRDYKKGDRYKDLALKRTIKKTIRRGHSRINKEDLSVFDREARGKVYIVYALDASGSMKGSKIDLCKKAGIALAYQAINENDKVGLLVFGSEVTNQIRPTSDFDFVLKEIAKIYPKKETDIASTILKSIELFPDEDVTKHLIILTDGMPTIGENPEQETVNATSVARYAGITVSVIGINLNKEGEDLARSITQTGDGNLYIVKNLENLDNIVLEDYYSLV
ncbi:MAG TPA: VWA domain-containing protein [Candidatus Nanoarchaeia archaeon]|nr:VWA domain-containing protein [Candidatus Nanoarchaeia archaeon]